MAVLRYEQFYFSAINEDTTSNLIQQKNSLTKQINDLQKKLLDVQAQLVNAQKQTLNQNPEAQIPMQEHVDSAGVEFDTIPAEAEIKHVGYYFGKNESGEINVQYTLNGQDHEIETTVTDFEEYLADMAQSDYDEDEVGRFFKKDYDGEWYTYFDTEGFWNAFKPHDQRSIILDYLKKKNLLAQ